MFNKLVGWDIIENQIVDRRLSTLSILQCTPNLLFLYDLMAWPCHSFCNWYFGNLIDVTQALALTTLKSLLPLAMVFNARNLKLGYFAGYWVVPCPNRIDCLKHHQSWITTSRVERSKQTIGQFDILAGLGHDIGQRPWKHNQPKLVCTSCDLLLHVNKV